MLLHMDKSLIRLLAQRWAATKDINNSEQRTTGIDGDNDDDDDDSNDNKKGSGVWFGGGV